MPFFIKIIMATDQKQLGKKFAIPEGNTLIGRVNPPCNIVLDGAKVSKKHCSLILKNTILSIQDHDSSNGIYLNGKKVNSAQLSEKDRLVIGDFTLEITVK